MLGNPSFWVSSLELLLLLQRMGGLLSIGECFYIQYLGLRVVILECGISEWCRETSSCLGTDYLTVQLCCRLVQTSHQHRLPGPNADRHPLTCVVYQICQHPLAAFPRSGFSVVLFMVTFTYLTSNHKIFTFECDCLFLRYWLPSNTKTRKRLPLPHSEHESQWHINDIGSGISGNLRANWMYIFISAVNVAWIAKRGIATLPAQF